MKTSKLLSIVITLAISRFISAQGTGCASAASLPVNASCTPIAFTVNNGFSGTGTAPCVSSTNDDAWYQFTATGTPTTVSITGSSNPIAVVVYSGSCASLTSVGCNDQGGASASVTVTTNPGNTYFVRLIRTNSGGGSTLGNICLTGPSALGPCLNADGGMTSSGSWDDNGNSVEQFPETSYEGTDASNTLGEVDAQVSLSQAITGLTIGQTYCLNFKYIKRSNCGPLSVTTNVSINGTNVGTITSSQSGSWTSSDMSVFTYCFQAASTAATIALTPSSGYTSSCGMLIDDACLSRVSSLAVELTDAFIACDDGRNIVLSWTTQSEDDNAYFTIQRSADYITFETLGTVAGAGNSSVTTHYTFTDPSPLLEMAYYRLSQTDYNGEEVLLSTLTSYCKAPHEWEIFPNPSNGVVNIVGTGISDAELALYTIHSELAVTGERVVQASDDHLLLDLSSLAAGIYVLKINGETKKIIKY